MKKAVKICLAMAGTLFVLGLILNLAGTAMGGREESIRYYEQWWEEHSWHEALGPIQVDPEGIHIGGENGIHVDSDGVDIGGSGGIHVGHHGKGQAAGNKQLLESGGLTGITAVDVDVSQGDVWLQEGEEFSVSLGWSINNYNMSYQVKDGTLRVEDENLGGHHLESFSGNCTAIITVPAGTQLEKLDLSTAWGDIEVDAAITAQKADLSTNMGDVVCQGLQAAELEAESDLGDVRLYLPGDRGEYTWELETNMGELTEDGEKRSGGLGEVAYRSGTGPNSVEASSSLGNVEISFS